MLICAEAWEKMKIIKLFSIGFALVFAGTLFAQTRIYLNDVEITGLKGQKFENCTVELDGAGDIKIIAPQYKIKTEETSASKPEETPIKAKTEEPPPAAPKAGGKRYYLVTSFSEGARADFDLDIFINGKFYKRILSHDPRVAEDITGLLKDGVENKFTISAVKNVPAGAPISTPDSFVLLVVGEASVSGDEVTIDKPLVNFRLTGAQSGTIHRSFNIKTTK